MASQEDLEFLIDRVPATNKVKGVSDYELEKMLSRNKMKMNFMNGIIAWVDKDSELHQMGKDSRILNGVDRTKEIINHLESKGYTQSPDVPINENKTITMSNEFKRMQKLAGTPVNEEKENLNEVYVAGGIVGVGAINHPKREKSDYEMAFEHFMNEGEEKEVKEMMDPEDEITGTDIDDIEISSPPDFGDDEIKGTELEEDDTMEEAVGIPAEASAIRDAVRKMIKDHEDDADLGAAIRKKFAK